MRKNYKNIAFLAELLINILVFSVACAILVGLFTRASEISRQTREESFAGIEVHSLFQTIQAEGPQGVTYGQLEQGETTVVCLYDSSWTPVENEAEAAYLIHLFLKSEEGEAGVLTRITARVETAKEKVIGNFETSVYTPVEGGAAG